MPDPLPPMCPSCGRRPQDSTISVQMTWAAQEEILCPICIRHWTKPKAHVGIRCAGCGRHTTALKGDLCKKCRDAGITAPTLFDAEGDPLA